MTWDYPERHKAVWQLLNAAYKALQDGDYRECRRQLEDEWSAIGAMEIAKANDAPIGRYHSSYLLRRYTYIRNLLRRAEAA